MGRKIITLCLTMLMFATCVISASAEEFDLQKTGSISVTLTEQSENTPIVGAELSVYCVGTIGNDSEDNLSCVYTQDFKNIGVAIDDPNLGTKLEEYISNSSVTSTKIYTDATGTAICEDLPLGLYFIRQTNAVEGFATCTPFLITVPMETADGYEYAVNASPKTEVAKLASITIKKVWNTDASAKAANCVTVQLQQNGKVVKTAVLNEQNDWQITYTNMPVSDGYSIKEIDIPKDFVATYKQEGNVFTVTNTSTLIQTGQLIWPIPVLAISGMILITLGVVLLWKKRKTNA